MRLLVITGSARPVRVGDQIASVITDLASRAGRPERPVDVQVADVAEIALPMLDEPQMAASDVYANEPTRTWAKTVSGADAVLFITSQHNFGYPASVKNAVDLVGGAQIPLPHDAYGPDGLLSDPAGALAPQQEPLLQVVEDLARHCADPGALPPAGPTAILSVPQAATTLVETFVAACNAHDADRFGRLFAEDAWFIDVVGHRLHGREQIRRAHAYAFSGSLEHAHLEPREIESRHIAPGVAYLEVTWRSRGHTAPPTPPTTRRPAGRLRVRQVAVFAVILALAGVVVLATATTALAAVCAAASSVRYGWFYSVVLERRTRHSTLLGGVAGAAPVLIGWAAVTGSLSVLPPGRSGRAAASATATRGAGACS